MSGIKLAEAFVTVRIDMRQFRRELRVVKGLLKKHLGSHLIPVGLDLKPLRRDVARAKRMLRSVGRASVPLSGNISATAGLTRNATRSAVHGAHQPKMLQQAVRGQQRVERQVLREQLRIQRQSILHQQQQERMARRARVAGKMTGHVGAAIPAASGIRGMKAGGVLRPGGMASASRFVIKQREIIRQTMREQVRTERTIIREQQRLARQAGGRVLSGFMGVGGSVREQQRLARAASRRGGSVIRSAAGVPGAVGMPIAAASGIRGMKSQSAKQQIRSIAQAPATSVTGSRLQAAQIARRIRRGETVSLADAPLAETRTVSGKSRQIVGRGRVVRQGFQQGIVAGLTPRSTQAGVARGSIIQTATGKFLESTPFRGAASISRPSRFQRRSVVSRTAERTQESAVSSQAQAARAVKTVAQTVKSSAKVAQRAASPTASSTPAAASAVHTVVGAGGSAAKPIKLTQLARTQESAVSEQASAARSVKSAAQAIRSGAKKVRSAVTGGASTSSVAQAASVSQAVTGVGSPPVKKTIVERASRAQESALREQTKASQAVKSAVQRQRSSAQRSVARRAIGGAAAIASPLLSRARSAGAAMFSDPASRELGRALRGGGVSDTARIIGQATRPAQLMAAMVASDPMGMMGFLGGEAAGAARSISSRAISVFGGPVQRAIGGTVGAAGQMVGGGARRGSAMMRILRRHAPQLHNPLTTIPGRGVFRRGMSRLPRRAALTLGGRGFARMLFGGRSGGGGGASGGGPVIPAGGPPAPGAPTVRRAAQAVRRPSRFGRVGRAILGPQMAAAATGGATTLNSVPPAGAGGRSGKGTPGSMARARVARSLLAGGIGAGIGASFSNAAGLLGLGAATSVLLAPAFALRSFAGFEQEAKNIEAIQGEQGFGKTSIARAIKQARDIGRETQFGAREIAEVQTFLSRRGFGIPELLEATPAIVDLAAAGGVPLHTAAQSTTSLLEQFGLGTDQTRSIVDQIALASITTPADVSSISEAMKHAGSLSSFAGMDPASAIAAVSASIGAGKAPGLAGRGLRAALRESMQQDAKDVFKKFGISGPFNDKGEFDFVKLVKEFERVFPNMDREQRASMLFESLETVGGSFMADLLRVGSAELEAREERLRTQSGGTAKRLRGIQDQTIGRASERLVDALQDLAFEGISPLADDIRELLDFTSGLIQAFSTSDGFRSFIGLVDEFVESFQRGTHMIGPLASEFTGWLGRMIEPLTNFYWVTSGLSDAMRGTNFIDLPNSIADVFDRLSFAVRNIGDVMIIAADSILALVDQLAQGMGFGNVVPQGVRDWFSDMAQSAQESINVREAQRRAEADGDNPKNRQKQGAADGGGLAGMGGGQFKPSFVGIGQLNSTIQSRLNDPAFKMQKQQVDLAKQQVKLQEKIAKGVAANKPAVAGAP